MAAVKIINEKRLHSVFSKTFKTSDYKYTFVHCRWLRIRLICTTDHFVNPNKIVYNANVKQLLREALS